MKILKKISFIQSLSIFILIPILYSFCHQYLRPHFMDNAVILNASLSVSFLCNLIPLTIFYLKISHRVSRYIFILLYILISIFFLLFLGYISPLSYLGTYLFYGVTDNYWSLDIFRQIFQSSSQ